MRVRPVRGTQARVGSPDSDGERVFPGTAVCLDVPDVVHHQDRCREATDRDREPERQPLELLELDEVGAVDGDEAEEEEDEQLAETGVAVGARAAGGSTPAAIDATPTAMITQPATVAR